MGSSAMTGKQPEALRLADAIGGWHFPAHPSIADCDAAAAELRRLHDENRRLVNTLNRVSEVRGLLAKQNSELLAVITDAADALAILQPESLVLTQARAAIAKVEGANHD